MKKLVLFMAIPLILISCSDLSLGDSIDDVVPTNLYKSATADNAAVVETLTDSYVETFEEIEELVEELSDPNSTLTAEEYAKKVKELEAKLKTLETLKKALENYEDQDGNKVTDSEAFQNVDKVVDEIQEKIDDYYESIENGTSQEDAQKTLSDELEKIKESTDTDTLTKDLQDAVDDLLDNAESIEDKSKDINELKDDLWNTLTDDQKKELAGDDVDTKSTTAPEDVTIEDIIAKVEENQDSTKQDLWEALSPTEREELADELGVTLGEDTTTVPDGITTEQIIEKIKSEISEIESLESQITEKEKEIAAKEAEIEEINNNSSLSDEEKQAKIKELEGEIATLTTEKTSLEEEKAALEAENSGLEEKLQSILETLGGETSDNSSASDVIDEIKDKVDTLQEDKEKAEDLIDETKDAAKDILKSLDDDITDTEIENMSVEEVIEQVGTKTKETLTDVLKTLESSKSDDEKTDTSEMTLKEIAAKITEEIESLQKDNNDLTTENESLSNENSSLTTTASENLTKALEILSDATSTTKNSYTTDSEDLDLATVLEYLQTEVDALQKTIEDGTVSYAKLQEQLTLSSTLTTTDTTTIYKDTCLEGVDLSGFSDNATVVLAESDGFMICFPNDLSGSSQIQIIFDVSDWTVGTEYKYPYYGLIGAGAKPTSTNNGNSESEGNLSSLQKKTRPSNDKIYYRWEYQNAKRATVLQLYKGDAPSVKIKAIASGWDAVQKLSFYNADTMFN